MIHATLAALAILLLSFALVIVCDMLSWRARVRPVAIVGLLLALFALAFLPRVGEIGVPLLASSGVGFVFTALFLLVGLLVVLASRNEDGAFSGSVLLAVTGMTIAAHAADLFAQYVAIELATVPSFALVAWGKSDVRVEAGVKYVLASLVASALLLLGVGLLALGSGSSSIAALSLEASPLLLVGCAALLAGLGFKMGVFPFNLWIPDVYQGAPAPIAGLLAGASEKTGFAALLVMMPFLSELSHIGWVLAGMAALTMTIPGLIALVQDDARRMVAYSIMTHAGFLLMGAAVMSAGGVAGLVAHAIAHAFLALGALLVLGVFASHGLDRIDDLSGAARRNPLLAGALSLFLLGLAGIPLMSGFTSKIFLFTAVARDGMLWLAVLAILNSTIALYYYFRIIRALYGKGGAGKPIEAGYGPLVAILICLFISVFLGLYPVPMYDLANWAAMGVFS